MLVARLFPRLFPRLFALFFCVATCLSSHHFTRTLLRALRKSKWTLHQKRNPKWYTSAKDASLVLSLQHLHVVLIHWLLKLNHHRPRSALYRAPRNACFSVPAYLSAASETPDLRVEISGVLELVDDHAADVMQQWVFVHSVLDFRNFAEVLKMECPSLTLIQEVTHGQ